MIINTDWRLDTDTDTLYIYTYTDNAEKEYTIYGVYSRRQAVILVSEFTNKMIKEDK